MQLFLRALCRDVLACVAGASDTVSGQMQQHNGLTPLDHQASAPILDHQSTMTVVSVLQTRGHEAYSSTKYNVAEEQKLKALSAHHRHLRPMKPMSLRWLPKGL